MIQSAGPTVGSAGTSGRQVFPFSSTMHTSTCWMTSDVAVEDERVWTAGFAGPYKRPTKGERCHSGHYLIEHVRSYNSRQEEGTKQGQAKSRSKA